MMAQPDLTLASFGEYLSRHADDLFEATLEHTALVGTTLAVAIVVAAALTVLCLRRPRVADALTEFLGAVYAIPSLALFALLIPLTGLGAGSAVIVMVIYCQFILVRNALEGLRGVDPAVIEAATGLGMDEQQVMRRVRIPLALPAIISGVRLAAVSCVGIATVAASINAGGLGAILFSGLRSLHIEKILAATLCCVAVALTADLALRAVERAANPVRRTGRQAR